MLKPGDYVIIKTLVCSSSQARYNGIIGASLVCTEETEGDDNVFVSPVVCTEETEGDDNVFVSPAIFGGCFMPNMLLKIEKLPIQLYAMERNSYVVFNTSLYLSIVSGYRYNSTMYYASPWFFNTKNLSLFLKTN